MCCSGKCKYESLGSMISLPGECTLPYGKPFPFDAMCMADSQWDIRWRCPSCGAENNDNMQVTATPFCDRCTLPFSWKQLVPRKLKEFDVWLAQHPLVNRLRQLRIPLQNPADEHAQEKPLTLTGLWAM